jgi:23S rRNA (adenine2503-C2)-methyltransferase
MTPMSGKPSLYDLSLDELKALLAGWGQPGYRAGQIYRQLYVHYAADPDQMTDQPKALRERLARETVMGTLTPRKQLLGDQGLTRKILWTLPDGSPVETVLMVYPDRATVCVSSQSGCPMQCSFCATGRLGFLHDLTPGQMVEQVLWAQRELGEVRRALATDAPARLTNLVYMGMGEPFNNYDAWRASVERLHDPAGYGMGARHFTVSTVGLVPGILRLAAEPWPVNLAISLHATDDELRSEMMPVNRRYPLAELMAAARTYVQQTRRRVSFEYVLLKEKNDEPEQARQLVDWLRPAGQEPLLCHVNLIPWNPVPGAPLGRSDRQRVLAFQAVLQQHRVPCTVRVERGMDIAAACGQLAGG